MEFHKGLHFDKLYDNLEKFTFIKQERYEKNLKFYHRMQNNTDKILDMCLDIDIKYRSFLVIRKQRSPIRDIRIAKRITINIIMIHRNQIDLIWR